MEGSANTEMAGLCLLSWHVNAKFLGIPDQSAPPYHSENEVIISFKKLNHSEARDLRGSTVLWKHSLESIFPSTGGKTELDREFDLGDEVISKIIIPHKGFIVSQMSPGGRCRRFFLP